MSRLFLLLGCCTTLWTTGRAQDCLGVTFKTGMNFELTTFNAKDKPTGKVNYEVKNVRREGGATVVDLTAQGQDERGRQQAPYLIRYTCTGTELVADLSGVAQTMQNTGMPNMEMKIKTNELIFPNRLAVGQKLPDGRMEAELLNDGRSMMLINIAVSNRQVEGQQAVTTPAGQFETYKVASDVSFDNRMMGMPIRSTLRVVSYRATNQLMDVRTESFNKNGKLVSYTLLSKAN